MQIRFIDQGELSLTTPDGEEKFSPGIGEIFPCHKIVYDDEERSFADVFLTEDRVIEGVVGLAFEPMGDKIYFRTTNVDTAE